MVFCRDLGVSGDVPVTHETTDAGLGMKTTGVQSPLWTSVQPVCLRAPQKPGLERGMPGLFLVTLTVGCK